MTWEWSGLCFQNTLWKIEGSHDNYLILLKAHLVCRLLLDPASWRFSTFHCDRFPTCDPCGRDTNKHIQTSVAFFSNTQSRGHWRKPGDQDSKCNRLPVICVWITNIWIVLCWSCLESPTFGLSCVWPWPASLIVASKGWVSFFIFCSQPSIRHWSCLLPLSL